MHIICLGELFQESPSKTMATISNEMGDCNFISVSDGHRNNILSGLTVPPTLSGAGQKNFVEANDMKW